MFDFQNTVIKLSSKIACVCHVLTVLCDLLYHYFYFRTKGSGAVPISAGHAEGMKESSNHVESGKEANFKNENIGKMNERSHRYSVERKSRNSSCSDHGSENE